MKFVDEAIIKVQAGKGGKGAATFRREKFIEFGGPDGGDGGNGGHVIMVGDVNSNTLADFRFVQHFKADNGQGGARRQMTGRGGEDQIIRVPLGTQIFDDNTNELIGDVIEDGQVVIVARGGEHGIGNVHFKSSTNRAPRKFTSGSKGEERPLRLELKVLADVGLLGLPNAGKSTFIRSVSSAKPKVADYPFTTLHANLGVVSVEEHRSFVVADIPGIIEGAAEGAGLGLTFLKHISRTRLLLHIVDMVPADHEVDPVDSFRVIENELDKYGQDVSNYSRWLVLNKIDLIPEDTQQEYCDDVVKQLDWKGPVYKISAIKKQGTKQLCFDIMKHVEEQLALNMAEENTEGNTQPENNPEENTPEKDKQQENAPEEMKPPEKKPIAKLSEKSHLED